MTCEPLYFDEIIYHLEIGDFAIKDVKKDMDDENPVYISCYGFSCEPCKLNNNGTHCNESRTYVTKYLLDNKLHPELFL